MAIEHIYGIGHSLQHLYKWLALLIAVVIVDFGSDKGLVRGRVAGRLSALKRGSVKSLVHGTPRSTPLWSSSLYPLPVIHYYIFLFLTLH